MQSDLLECLGQRTGESVGSHCVVLWWMWCWFVCKMQRWQMADGRWQMADGRWQMADSTLDAMQFCRPIGRQSEELAQLAQLAPPLGHAESAFDTLFRASERALPLGPHERCARLSRLNPDSNPTNTQHPTPNTIHSILSRACA